MSSVLTPELLEAFIKERVEAGELYSDYLCIDDIEFAPRNPRIHDLDTLDGSIKRFGHTEPITIDETTGLLVSGHGRIKKLREIQQEGGPKPRYIRDVDGRWHVLVTRGIHFENQAEADAYLIAINNTAQSSSWDTTPYLEMVSDIESLTGSLAGLAISEDDLAKLKPPEFQPVDDEPPRLDEKKKVICPHCKHEFEP
ncbi:MAG: hypothetical protein AAF267_23285 [Deinococcota bacterium]